MIGTFLTFFGSSLYHLLLDIASLSNNVADIAFPNFIGYIFIIWGIQKLKENSSFSKAQKSSKTAFALNIIVWTYNLITESLNIPDFMLVVSLIVGLLGLVEWIYYTSTFYYIAIGLEALQTTTGLKAYSQIAKKAWIGVIIFNVVAFICTSPIPIIALVSYLISYIAQIIYWGTLVAFYRGGIK